MNLKLQLLLSAYRRGEKDFRFHFRYNFNNLLRAKICSRRHLFRIYYSTLKVSLQWLDQTKKQLTKFLTFAPKSEKMGSIYLKDEKKSLDSGL